MLKWVLKFNPYDLYTKIHEAPDEEALRPFYEDLIAQYFPPKLRWQTGLAFQLRLFFLCEKAYHTRIFSQ